MSEYIELCLVKITDPDKYLSKKEVSYYAVSEDTADSLLYNDYSYSNNSSLRKIKTEWLGYAQVEITDNLKARWED